MKGYVEMPENQPKRSSTSSYVVAIYLKGGNLNPAVITERTMLTPTTSQIRGGFKPGSDRFVAKLGMWSLRAKTDSCELADYFDELLSKCATFDSALSELEGVEDAYLDVLLLPADAQEAKELMCFSIDQKHIRSLARLGLYVQFTSMGPTNELSLSNQS